MKDFQKRTKLLHKNLTNLKESYDFDGKNRKIKEIEAKATDPDFWKDQAFASKLMQEMGDLQNEIEKLAHLTKEIEVLRQLEKPSTEEVNTLIGLEKEFEKFKLRSYLSGKHDPKSAIVSIHAGQGGTEAMDWTSMLYRMYLRFCEKKNWKTHLINISEGEEAGIKSVTFKVEGRYAYGYLKGEVGTHRLVRQSPFNADKLRQTSFSLVEVLPELEEIDVPEIKLNDDDLEWQFFRASSQGGQNVQKVSSAVRLKHKPTEIVVTAQTERYQEQNRMFAMSLLRAKLWAKKQEDRQKAVKKIKGEYQPASWGRQIRSYVLHPYKMVKDLRTNVETGNAEGVLDGDLDEFIEAELQIHKS